MKDDRLSQVHGLKALNGGFPEDIAQADIFRHTYTFSKAFCSRNGLKADVSCYFKGRGEICVGLLRLMAV